MFRASKQPRAVAAWLAIGCFALSAQAAPQPMRVAVLVPESPRLKNLAAVLEISLGRMENVVLLDRTAVDQVLKEQQLQAMFAPAAVSQRASLGQLLKADMLVMLREQTKPRKHLEVSVCETNQGMRLSAGPLPAEPVEAAVDAVDAMVRRAMRKARENIATVVSVPPLVDDSLSFDNNYLMPAYARLIEQTLLEQPGVVVVELGEAEAIAREMALAGGAVARPLPVALLGHFRAETASGKKTLSLSLTAKCGEKTIGNWQRTTVSLADAPQELRKAAIGLLEKSAMQPLLPSDGAAESAQLAAGAKSCLEAGYCSEALAQIEASLMLKPRQPELHGQAVTALAYLIDNALVEGKPEDAARRAIALRRAQLLHVESFALETRLGFAAGAEVLLRGRFRRFHSGMHSVETALPGHRFPSEIAEAWRACRDEEEAMIQRVLRAKSEAEVQDTAVFCLGGDPTEYWEKGIAADDAAQIHRYEAVCQRQLELCRRFAYLNLPEIGPANWQKIFPVPPPRTAGAAQLQIYLKFLEDVQTAPNKMVQGLTKVEIGRVRDILERGAPDAAVAAVTRATFPHSSEANLPSAERSTTKTAVLVRPITLTVDNLGRSPKPLAAPIDRWLPAGPHADLLISAGRCYLVKQRGHVSPIAEDLTVDGPKAVFDGRFDWVFGHRGYEPLLAIVDPVNGQATRFTAADGLPATGFVGAIAALGPGRVCALGNAGAVRQGRLNEDRTWIAIAAVDLVKGKEFRVFHVARRLPDGSDSPEADAADLSFHCSAICLIVRPPTADKASELRVLIARSFGPQQRARPLLAVPDRNSVEVLPAAFNAQRACVLCQAEGSFYWVDDPVPPLNAEGTLYRLGYPELRPLAVNRHVPARGQVFLDGGRLFARSQEDGKACWYMSDHATSPLRKLTLQGDEPAQYGPLCHSTHYGLVELSTPPLEIVLPKM